MWGAQSEEPGQSMRGGNERAMGPGNVQGCVPKPEGSPRKCRKVEQGGRRRDRIRFAF